MNNKSANILSFSKGTDGLLPAIVQDHQSGEVLMLAYINEESWCRTLASGQAHYWSRSRNKIWLKGESSGHIQLIKEIRVDCDADAVIFKVEQLGKAACHTGHRTCFYRRLTSNGDRLESAETPVFDPAEIYQQ
ncbi:MAG: phosphoribosyl-AMP cyclohydrolase [Desulfobulbaceae bacterium]|nr:MAG: phosphoribosyl-AMP cyclohydrolase [Desulfobulbaceae bacterium]